MKIENIEMLLNPYWYYANEDRSCFKNEIKSFVNNHIDSI